jgi:hypothetical protein
MHDAYVSTSPDWLNAALLLVCHQFLFSQCMDPGWCPGCAAPPPLNTFYTKISLKFMIFNVNPGFASVGF